MLTEEQIRSFRRDGYDIVPAMYDVASVGKIATWTEEILGWPELPGEHMVYYEDSLIAGADRVVSRVENFCPFHAGFDDLIRTGAMIDAVSQLLGEAAVLFKEKINMKMPGGDGFKAHQDAQAGWNVYSDFHITALVSIDAATTTNGCLEMAAGWHDRGLIGNEWQPLDDGEGSEIKYHSCPTQPGDVVLFDSYAPHRSAPNLTQSPRRVLYVTYNRRADGDHRAQYYADKRKSFPPDVERETGKEYVFRV